MKVTSINNHEKEFFKNGIDSHGKSFILEDKIIDIKGSSKKMKYVQCRRIDGDESFFYADHHPKKRIVLHFTVGFLRGDIAMLTKPNNHISTAFVLARNGKIINLFSSAAWSYHLGSGAIGGNTKGSQDTIAIEISNIGLLRKNGDDLTTIYSSSDQYCSLEDTRQYIELAVPYRGEKYFATFTRKQYKSLIILLKYLTAQYDIPKEFLPESKRYNTLTEKEIEEFEGILSHVNYRPTGKWDVGPAFDWDETIFRLKTFD